MPQWIHDRADHIRAKNPGMPKSESFAIATQQAYAAGKAPKSGFGTSKGKREARQKYDEPKSEYKKVADPSSKTKAGSISLVSLLGFSNELQKIAQLPKPTSLGDTRKIVANQGTAMSVRKPSYAKVNKDSIAPASAAGMDLTQSAKTIQTPPQTMPSRSFAEPT